MTKTLHKTVHRATWLGLLLVNTLPHFLLPLNPPYAGMT